MPEPLVSHQRGFNALKSVTAILVVALWLLPAWAIWLIYAHPEWQSGLHSWQLRVLLWFPIIAILMLYFLVVLYRRLPGSWLGVAAYVIGTVGMAALHWWLNGATSLTVLMIEWAAFSLTLFVAGFSFELFRRILQMAIHGHWVLAVFGGLANIGIFVVPGVMITISLYAVLYHQGMFDGDLLMQLPYGFGLAVAIWHDWRSFRSL